MVFIEICKALTEVKRWIQFFEGSNLVFQLWMMEDSPSLTKANVIDHCFLNHVEVIEQRILFDKFPFPVGVDACIEFLGSRD